MAVGSYYDVYTVPEYEQRVQNIKSSIIELKGGDFFIEAESKLRDQIARLEAKEKQFLSKINIEGVKTLEDLNRHLAEYRKVTLNLSGPALVQAFTGVLEEKNAAEYDFFNKEVTAIIKNEIFQNQDIQERSYEWVHDQVMSYLNQGLVVTKGIDVSFRSKKGFTTEGIFPANFTNSQKKKWKKIIAQRMKDRGIGNGQWDMEAFASGTVLTTSFNWFDTTKKMTQTDAKKLPPAEIIKINNQIKKAILAQTGDKALMGSIIDHVLTNNRVAFFVGKNVNDITGILGEIQGLYYLSKLFGGMNATKMPSNLTWRGGTYTGENTTKPHQDLLFETFGIQVKNSTKELIGSVGFANASIETMLAKTGMSEAAKNVFYNYYGTKEFNIPYHREGTRDYRSGLRMTDKGAQEYLNARNDLLNCENDIEELLNLFAASFMYMDVAEDLSLEDANTFYLVGGTAFYAASSILKEVLDKLRSEARSLKVTSSVTLGKNIIDALNSGKGRDYSSAMVKNIKLTSSYKF